MEKRTAFAPGKIILSGEYAVLFEKEGIAIPSSLGVRATLKEQEDVKSTRLSIRGSKDFLHPFWQDYLRSILRMCEEQGEGMPAGTLSVESNLPAGKGMGASTAAVIAVCKCLLPHATTEEIRSVEDTVNPGHSGIDFTVIWGNAPVLFKKGSVASASLPPGLLTNAWLIDTGMPGETTAELVAWVREREKKCTHAIEEIDACTHALLEGVPLAEVFPRHHRAQVALGVVPKHVQTLIARIEESGGAAKVIGAGAKTGGGGMVLAIHEDRGAIDRAAKGSYPLSPL